MRKNGYVLLAPSTDQSFAGVSVGMFSYFAKTVEIYEMFRKFGPLSNIEDFRDHMYRLDNFQDYRDKLEEFLYEEADISTYMDVIERLDMDALILDSTDLEGMSKDQGYFLLENQIKNFNLDECEDADFIYWNTRELK